ncbi:putative nucleic acid-binding protein [Rosa chinensis]|uniref:Putative nucleic acid-binding protein n=1 Tax=Rosa chinensis TaxID=74649 RepID=A0A2P6Q9C2_ROSCH|nr:putative nucleic acid-binding protein [Rosa chinensis]
MSSVGDLLQVNQSYLGLEDKRVRSIRYEGCPQCYKQLTVQKNSDLQVCLDHSMQIPLPCYRVHATIEDPNSEATIKLRGKPVEQLFGITCRDLIDSERYLSKHKESTKCQHTSSSNV